MSWLASPRRPVVVIVAVGVAVLWPYVVPAEEAHRTATQLLALVLVGWSLHVTVRWLGVLTLFQPAAAAAGAGASASLLAMRAPLVLALLAGAVAGAAVGLASLAPAATAPRLWLPVTSFALAAGFALIVPRLVLRPFVRPVVLGVDLSGDRALYLLGVGILLICGLLLAGVRGRLGGRASSGSVRHGGVVRWAGGVGLSGALAGIAGCLTGIIHQGWPSPLEFAPATAVAYLAIPVVAGGSLITGTVLGAGVFLATARIALALGWSSLAPPAAVLVLVCLTGRSGLPLIAARRR